VEGHIKPGDDFVAVLNAWVEATDVVLAVIGPRWSDLLATRANDPDDFVLGCDVGKRSVSLSSAGDPERRCRDQ
jgi:hypothetical protein